VHEQVLASVVRRDKAEPLLCIKPLDFTSAHCPTPSSLVLRNGDSLTSPGAFLLRDQETLPAEIKKILL
jgi:hypothetical protein